MVQPAAPEPVPEEPEVKNDWADRMAKAALARMAQARSTLVAGEISEEAAKAIDSNGAAIIKPSHPFDRPRLVLKPRASSELPRPSDSTTSAGRPRLSLQPRSMPLAEPARDDPNRPKLNLLPRSKPVESECAPAAEQEAEWKRSDGASAGARPRLALQPRSKAVETEAGVPSKTASIFGAARPREQVLRDRGIETGSMDSNSDRHAVNSRPVSAAVSVTSADDEWQTVGKARKAGSSALSQESNILVLDDPLLSHSRPVNMAAQRVYSGDFPHGSGSYGSHGSYGRHFPHSRFEPQQVEDDGGDVFRRALPTRSNLY
jgi:hypothetical protein